MDRQIKKKLRQEERGLFLSSLISAGIGTAVALVLLVIAPFMLLPLDDPNSLALFAAAACIFLGGATGGYLGASSAKGNELWAALISGSAMLLLLLLVSFVFGTGFNLISFLVIIGALFISSVVGALFAKRISSDQARNMKKAMKRR